MCLGKEPPRSGETYGDTNIWGSTVTFDGLSQNKRLNLNPSSPDSRCPSDTGHKGLATNDLKKTELFANKAN